MCSQKRYWRKEDIMTAIDPMHHICLTLNSKKWRELLPKELSFFAEFLGMNACEINVEDMDYVIHGCGDRSHGFCDRSRSNDSSTRKYAYLSVGTEQWLM